MIDELEAFLYEALALATWMSGALLVSIGLTAPLVMTALAVFLRFHWWEPLVAISGPFLAVAGLRLFRKADSISL